MSAASRQGTAVGGEPALRFDAIEAAEHGAASPIPTCGSSISTTRSIPSACNLFAEVDQRMGAFIAKHLGVPLRARAPSAEELLPPIRHDAVRASCRCTSSTRTPSSTTCTTSISPPCRRRRSWPRRSQALPGRRLIFTNGSRRHAERVAEKLGVLHLFEDICDIAACEFVAKPSPDAFDRMIDRHGVAPRRGRHVRGHAAQSRGAARARHDDRARAFRLCRPSGAAADAQLDASCPSISIMQPMT